MSGVVSEKVVAEVKDLALSAFYSSLYQQALSLFQLLLAFKYEDDTVLPYIEICENRLAVPGKDLCNKKNVDIEVLCWLDSTARDEAEHLQLLQSCVAALSASLTFIKPSSNSSNVTECVRTSQVGHESNSMFDFESLDEALGVKLCSCIERGEQTESLFITISEQYLQQPERLITLLAKHIADEQIHCYKAESLVFNNEVMLVAQLAEGAIFSSRMFTDDFPSQLHSIRQFSSTWMPFLQAHA
ncbi:MAG: hypothetical protein NWQ54_08665, partial [Paraglaciecola sp.]|nr:hypothetical protein [Paraglaciecola sp.]